MNYIQNKLDEFRKNIYGDSDALFDRSGNNVSTQVENEFIEALTDYRNNIVDMLAENKQDYKLYDGDIITAITMPKIREVLSLLQDTNK